MKGRCAVRRIWKLVLMIVIVCFEAVAVSGCDDLESLRRPAPDPKVQWVSETPYMYYFWDEEEGYQGKLIVGENTWPITVRNRSSNMYVLLSDPETTSLTLFYGSCKFARDQITVTVRQDNADIFGGDLPTIVFIRKNKDEGEDKESQADSSSVLTESEKGDDISQNSDGNK